MKNLMRTITWMSLMFVMACSPATMSTDAGITPSDIASFKISNATALFSAESANESTGVSSKAAQGSRSQLYTLLETGDYLKQKYIDQNGVEHDLEVTVTFIKWLSKKNVAIGLSNGFEGLVNLNDGSILQLSSYGLSLNSLVLFSHYVFAFSKDLKSLKRLDTNNGAIYNQITLSGNQKFLSGARFPIAYSQLWWRDDGSVDEDAKSFASILIDKDLNVLAQIEDNQVFPYIAISNTGDSASVHADFNSSVGFVYKNEKLYSVHSFSGFYVHLWPQSPEYSSVDITLSEVSILQTGLNYAQVQQIKPFSVLQPRDNKMVLCRGNYTADSDKRYVFLGWGLLKIDLSTNVQSALSFKYLANVQETLSSMDVYRPSNTCYISGSHVYYLKGSDKIYRFNLEGTSISEELLVQRAGIKSFHVAGKYVFYSTAGQGYRIDKNTPSAEQTLTDDFSFSNIVNIQ